MAKEVVALEVTANASQAEGSVKSLKAQLREAQAEVQKMSDKFGLTSKQAVEAAKKAAELKDAIGDAKSLTDAFNPDAKFKAFSSTLSGVAGGFSAIQGAMALVGAEGKDVEKMMLKVQSAMAISQGLQALGEAADSFKILKSVAVNAFNAIKGAIAASGIGLLVIALGTIYAYWDNIKEAVSGVSNEQKKLLETQKKSAEVSKNKLDNISKEENILKLQGKSERDILQLKIKATEESIKGLEAQIITQEQIKVQQIEAAKRNRDILTGILNFLTYPIKSLLTTVDKVGSALGQDFGLVKGFEGGIQSVASYVFDPKQTEEEANKTIQETKNKLLELKNSSAGFKLEINKIDKEHNKKTLEETKKTQDEILKLQQENTLARIKDERKRQELKLEIDLENAKRGVKNAQELQLLEEKYMLDLRALKDKFAEEDKKKADEKAKELLKANEDALKQANDLAEQNYLKTIKSDAERAKQKENLDYEKKVAEINAMQISEFEKNSLLQQTAYAHQLALTDIEKKAQDERLKNEQASYDAKVALYKQTGDALTALSDLIGKQTGVGKALALAQIAIDTGIAISGIVRQASKNPLNLTPVAFALDIATRSIAVLANIKKAKD